MEKLFGVYTSKISKLNRLYIYIYNYRKFTFKSKSSFTSCLDSDSEDELKRSVALSQRLCDMSGNEQQQEDVEKVSNGSSEYLTIFCLV